jgi:hypothetical protein
VRKASKETWRAFCTSITELPKAARLHRALSKDLNVRLGSLVAPSGKRTQSEEETLEHFPDSQVVEEEGTSGFASHTMQLDWQVAAKLSPIRE